MNGFNVDPGVARSPQHSRQEERQARTVIQQHMDAEHFVRDVLAESIYDDAASGALRVAVNQAEVVSLPTATTAQASWKILSPKYALDGIWRVQIYYSHSATGQAANATLSARKHVPGTGIIGTGGAALSTVVTFPAVSAIGELNVVDVDTAGVVVLPSHAALTWGLTRSAVDGGTANLLLYGVRCYFTPQRNEV